MKIHQIKKYWTDTGEKLYTYKLSQMNNPPLLKATVDFFILFLFPLIAFGQNGKKELFTGIADQYVKKSIVTDRWLLYDSNGQAIADRQKLISEV